MTARDTFSPTMRTLGVSAGMKFKLGGHGTVDQAHAVGISCFDDVSGSRGCIVSDLRFDTTANLLVHYASRLAKRG
jgi:hypothetical protein